MSAQGNVVIPNVTILASALFEPEVPRFKPDAKPEYSLWGAIPKDQVDAVRAKILEAVGLASSKGYQMPLKDGDATDDEGQRKHAPYLEGMAHFRAKTNFELGSKNLLAGPQRLPAKTSQVYSGVQCAVIVRPKTWQYEGKQGVSLYLQAVLITGAGTRLEIGGGDASAEFDSAEINFGQMPEDDDGFGDDLIGGGDVPF